MISEDASPRTPLGSGRSVYVAHLSRQLVRLGFLVDVFTRRDRPDLPTIVQQEDGSRIIHVTAGPPEPLPNEELLSHVDEFTLSLLDFSINNPGYHLAHANSYLSGLVAARLKETVRVPFVVTFHGLGLVRLQYQGKADRFAKERTAIERRVMREADRIVAECPQDCDDQVALYGADPKKIRMAPCGFDPAELSPVDKITARTLLELDANEPLVVYIGRMTPRKGVDSAIRGFARLVRKGINARMLVVGGESDDPDPRRTPEIGRLQKLAKSEHVADRVAFTGHRGRDALRYYYSAADVFVTTPWYEPFGITPVEAMACGTPVIGTNVGGIKYTVEDGKTGYLVPPNDPDALAERMQRLMADAELRERMGQAGIARANEHFTWKRVAELIGDVYEDAWASQPGARRWRPAPVTVG